MGCCFPCFRTRRTRDVTQTARIDGNGGITTTRTEEVTRNGHRQSPVQSYQTFPHDSSGRGADQLTQQESDGPGPVVATMQKRTSYTTKNKKAADALMKNDAEAEKRQMAIMQDIVGIVATSSNSSYDALKES